MFIFADIASSVMAICGSALAKELIWLPERVWLSICGTNLDRGADVTIAEAIGVGFFGGIGDSSSRGDVRSSTHRAKAGLNGYRQSI